MCIIIVILIMFIEYGTKYYILNVFRLINVFFIGISKLINLFYQDHGSFGLLLSYSYAPKNVYLNNYSE